jgi:hypothetical protein
MKFAVEEGTTGGGKTTRGTAASVNQVFVVLHSDRASPTREVA